MEEEKSPMTGMTQEEKDEYVMGKAMDIIMGSGDARLHASKAMDHIAKGELDAARSSRAGRTVLFHNFNLQIKRHL